jgi:anti-sigma factor RsiW
MNCELTKSNIFAYVDGELGREPRAAMEQHLASCSACRRCVEQELTFRDRYVVRLRPDSAPPHLRESVDRLLGGLIGSPRARRRAPVWIAAGAAAVLLLALGIAVGVALQTMRQRADLLAELTEASVEQHQKLASGQLPPDLTDGSPRRAEAWFRRRLDFNVTVPELASDDVTLLGARISHLGSVPAAALEYRLDQRNVSLFVIPDEAYRRLGLSEKPKFKTLNHRGYDVIIWRQHGTGYALVSEIGTRSCLVCHSPDEKLDASFESVPHRGASPAPRREASPRRIDS